jgi:hypothetical protein
MQMFNQHINNLFLSINYQRGKIVSFLLTLIAGIIISIVIATYLAANGASANTYKTSWIGNTFGGGDKWVQNYIEAMYVAPNGTVYANSTWEEAGREAGIYKDGDVIGLSLDTHGWSRAGGKAVTANSKYLYLAMIQGSVGNRENYPPEKTTWYCVRRYDLSGKPAPFKGGRGHDRSMLIVSTKGEVTGLATSGNELYVSDSAENKIRVYNSETGAEIRSFSLLILDR